MNPEQIAKVLRHTGAVFQGAVIGVLLVLAIIALLATSNAVQLFRYQGF